MRIEDLVYLLEIARTRSFSTAANNLHISQPSISQAIKKLEDELNTNLFIRSRAGITLTEIGEDIARKAQAILKLVEEINNVSNMFDSEYTGKLSIGVIPNILTPIPGTINTFKKSYPKIDLEFVEDGSQQIMDQVKNNELDIGIIATPNNLWGDEDLLVYKKLAVGEVMACVGKNSPLASFRSLTPEQIINYPIVHFGSRFASITNFINELRKFGEVKTLFSSTNNEISKRVITEGLAIGFMLSTFLSEDLYVKSGDIIPLPVTDIPNGLTFGCIYSKKLSFPPIYNEFIKVFKSQLTPLVPNLFN
ncbi:LysR family transcriptional regulator [Sporosarcina soli]|uniref:LysR family transcriptional regulator n=1 Tax=Sporosarcina soli TaxID=334736 RepID=A0ABW0TNQ4_9BACL